MSWNGVNLEAVLKRRKYHSEKRKEDEVLEAFKQLLRKEDRLDDRVLRNIFGSDGRITELKTAALSPDKIYQAETLKKLCTDYRLRFLDARYYKGEIPYEAVSRLKRLQRIENTELKGFKIMAPAGMFSLRSKDRDPLLFIPLGKDRYYLVHKWGADLSLFRKLWVFPFRNFKTLLACVALFSLLVVSMIPDSAMGNNPGGTASLRVICFFYFFIATSGLTALYGFSRMRDFNSGLWNSKYLD